MQRNTMRIICLLSVLTAFFLITAASFACSDDPPEKAAQQAAESWMPLLDSGKYAESWDSLAKDTKAHIDKRTWEVYLTATRKPMGEVVSRKLKRAEFIKSLPGVPDQAGAVLEYESSFKGKKAVTETFGMIREKDGTWKVANYIPRD